MKKSFFFFALGIFLATGPSLALASDISIEWSVGNRYRVFDYIGGGAKKDAKESSQLFERYAPRKNESNEAWIARLTATSGSPYTAIEHGPWNEDHGGSAPGYVKDFHTAPSYFLINARLVSEGKKSPLPSNAQCTWKLDGQVILTQSCIGELQLPSFPGVGGVLSVVTQDMIVAEQSIIPKVRIILGMGDSYGAGEGSPDRATIWSKEVNEVEWPLGNASRLNSLVKQPAAWLSPRCNRSFYSYQNLVALRLATEDIHSTVAFIHLACAGAEVVDGMLAPQRMAPGYDPECSSRDSKNIVDNRCDVPVSQLAAAVKTLCKSSPSQLSAEQLNTLKNYLSRLRYGADQIAWISDLMICSPGEMHPIENILLSIGGNDMGFSGVILWGLMPISNQTSFIVKRKLSNFIVGIARNKGGIVCPYKGALGKCSSPNIMTAAERIGELPDRYQVLDYAFRTLLEVQGNKVVLNTYTNPLQDESGKLCGDVARTNTKNAWYGTRMLIPSLFSPKQWEINLTQWEAAQVNRSVIPFLNSTIKKASSVAGWRVALMDGRMDRRGWCTGKNVAILPLNQAYTWNPYEENIRMVRTGSDSVLTQWPGKIRRDGLSGTFHPNAYGYAVIAEAVNSALKD